MIRLFPVLAVAVIMASTGCSTSRSAATPAGDAAPARSAAPAKAAAPPGIFSEPPFASAHVGVSVYDVAAEKYLYDYQSDKYFVPASNTKLFTLYAGLKYLKDSLPGIYYQETPDSLFIFPAGDPTFLHPEFKKQPVVEKLQKVKKPVVLVNSAWNDEAFGAGWTWDDYNDSYAAERSPLPVYGNTVRWIQVAQKNTQPELQDSLQTFVYSNPEVDWKVRFLEDTANKTFTVHRRKEENYFEVKQGRETFKDQFVPFITNGVASAIELLKDTVGKEITVRAEMRPGNLTVIRSQPVDSLFRPMMYRSDNFFAEQTLLMASNEKLQLMQDAAMIDTLLSTDLKDAPQKPHWVDGSGLSRYNLFTPQDFVWILKKLKDEFGLDRMKRILPGSDQGTLANYYNDLKGNFFAKTGTLYGDVALSGYMTTRSNKQLIFSVLVNNHQSSGTSIRRGVEKFLLDVWRNN